MIKAMKTEMMMSYDIDTIIIHTFITDYENWISSMVIANSDLYNKKTWSEIFIKLV